MPGPFHAVAHTRAATRARTTPPTACLRSSILADTSPGSVLPTAPRRAGPGHGWGGPPLRADVHGRGAARQPQGVRRVLPRHQGVAAVRRRRAAGAPRAPRPRRYRAAARRPGLRRARQDHPGRHGVARAVAGEPHRDNGLYRPRRRGGLPGPAQYHLEPRGVPPRRPRERPLPAHPLRRRPDAPWRLEPLHGHRPPRCPLGGVPRELPRGYGAYRHPVPGRRRRRERHPLGRAPPEWV
jgi:hypothetical protein